MHLRYASVLMAVLLTTIGLSLVVTVFITMVVTLVRITASGVKVYKDIFA